LRAKYAKAAAEQKLNPPSVESTAEIYPVSGRNPSGLFAGESSQQSPTKEKMRPPSTNAFRMCDGSCITLILTGFLVNDVSKFSGHSCKVLINAQTGQIKYYGYPTKSGTKMSLT
jgi:hypothetical protein